MTWLLGRGVECSLVELHMKPTALAASPGGDPFASEIDRAFWELGYVNGSFDTEAEAQAAIDELVAARPEFASSRSRWR